MAPGGVPHQRPPGSPAWRGPHRNGLRVTRLVLVPTPIGNLEDITLRALEALRSADVVAAEDTRHSRTLLARHGIDRPLERLDAHTIATRAPHLLAAHERIAYVTDAGTPGISDPGEELVRIALERGDEVEVLPGPTAFVPALVLSGLPTARFAFEGFLPRRGSDRTARLAAIAERTETTILYESPHRLLGTLQDLADACGADRPAAVSRELTKRFETTYRGALGSLVASVGPEVKGEIVVVVGPAPPRPVERDFRHEAEVLARSGLQGRTMRDALQELGAPRNVAYDLALEHGAEG